MISAKYSWINLFKNHYRYFTDNYLNKEKIFKKLKKRSSESITAKREVSLLSNGFFPESLKEVITYHHSPGECSPLQNACPHHLSGRPRHVKIPCWIRS